jgi:hypothetical protein
MFDITKEHPEYSAWSAVWPKYRDLYTGGEQFIANAHNYLVPRQKEPGDVFRERLARVYYENYIGSIIDWYAATLFRREPLVSCEAADASTRGFYNTFAEDCDRRGSTLSDFFRRQLVETLVMGKSYILIDFPKGTGAVRTKAEEEAAGISRAYLCELPATSVTHWERSENGALESAVVRYEIPARGDDPRTKETRWVRYDQTTYRIFSRIGADTKTAPVEVESGRHALARVGRVPLVEFTLGPGLWLMNKAASLQIEHFNKSNALAWAITMGLFAMPVIYSERNWNEVFGEAYYIQLGPGDKFGWSEPEGHVYDLALRNIDRLKEEIYRICYLLHQAGGSLSKNSALTGLSKQRDYVVTQEVLRRFGDQVKDTLKIVLRSIAEAREDACAIEVSGLDEFDIGDFSSELDDASRLLGLGIPSETLKRQVHKKLAMKYLCDISQTSKDQIASEIDGL